jgi:hypothetical protein
MEEVRALSGRMDRISGDMASMMSSVADLVRGSTDQVLSKVAGLDQRVDRVVESHSSLATEVQRNLMLGESLEKLLEVSATRGTIPITVSPEDRLPSPAPLRSQLQAEVPPFVPTPSGSQIKGDTSSTTSGVTKVVKPSIPLPDHLKGIVPGSVKWKQLSAEEKKKILMA